MKFRIDNKFLYVTESTQAELEWLDKKLTWEYEDDTPPDKLLIQEEGKTFTFWGMYYLIKNHCDCPYPLELENEPPLSLDKTANPTATMLVDLELMDFQVAAAKKSLMLKKGILSIPTGGGKTEIILTVIRYLLDHKMLKNIVIVVPSVGLGEQLYERALKRGFTNEEISMLHGNAEYQNTPVLVGVVNSINIALNKDNECGKRIRECNALFYDEAHHSSAPSYMRIALDTNPEYLLMYSASPFNSKNIMEYASNVLLFGLTGSIIYSIPQKYLRELGLIAEPYIFYKTVPGRVAKYMGKYNNIYNTYIVNDTTRNAMITRYASKFVALGFKTLILVQRLEHARKLMLSLKGKKVICIFGGAQGLQMDEYGIIEEFVVDYNIFRQNFEAGLYDIVIGSPVLDEGFDIPAISAVILAGAGKSRIKLLQRVGRGLRRKKIGKNQVYLIDFHDRGHVFMQSQYRKRRELMEEIEATIIEDEVRFFNIIIEHSKEVKELLNGPVIA